jgi:hypothetical protein
MEPEPEVNALRCIFGIELSAVTLFPPGNSTCAGGMSLMQNGSKKMRLAGLE